MLYEVITHGNFTYVSPKVFDLLGYTPEELVGKNAFDLMTEEEASRVNEHYSQFVLNKMAFKGMINVNLHKDGHEVIMESNGEPILGKNNERNNFV